MHSYFNTTNHATESMLNSTTCFIRAAQLVEITCYTVLSAIDICAKPHCDVLQSHLNTLQRLIDLM